MMKFNSTVPLVSHVTNCRCRRPNKRETTVLTKLSEDSTLGQESIPRVNSLITETTRVIIGLAIRQRGKTKGVKRVDLCAGANGGVDDGGSVQVTEARRWRPDSDGLVGGGHV